jgi:hypothetical protein
MVHFARLAGFDDEADEVRSPLRIRWWCTAAVASRAGIGTRSARPCRSDRMMML